MKKDIDSKAGVESREVRIRAVRRALREGDPAPEPQPRGLEGEADSYAPLSPEEVVVMRATMLRAVPEERRFSLRFLSILVGSALTLAAWGGVSLLTWLGRLPVPGGEAAPRVATTSPPAEAPAPVSGSPGPGRLPAPAGAGPAATASPSAGGPSAPDGHVHTSRAGSAPSGSARSPRVTPPRPGAAPSILSAPTARLASVGGSIEESAPEAAPGAAPAASPAIRELQFSTPGGTRIVWVFASGDAPVSETPRPARL